MSIKQPATFVTKSLTKKYSYTQIPDITVNLRMVILVVKSYKKKRQWVINFKKFQKALRFYLT